MHVVSIIYFSNAEKKIITYLGLVEVKLLKHAIEYEKYCSSSVNANESRHLPRDSCVNESHHLPRDSCVNESRHLPRDSCVNESRHLPRDSCVNESSFIFVIISLILGIYSLC